jgi:thioester reductase-like protein
MSDTVFITGATGGVGAHFVTQLLSRASDTRVVLLVRAENESAACDRVHKVVQALDPQIDLAQAHDRLTVIVGDITEAELGLSAAEAHALAARVTHIVHAAATTKFHVPIEVACHINVTGTQNVLRFGRRVCEAGGLRHFAHISTAYVCGTRCGVIREDEPIAGERSCSNSYDESKCEAERVVRAAMQDMPISIFRPSIVVGDSRTGRTTAFNGLYAPLRLIQRGLATAIPARPDTPLDVVSTDYISDVLQHVLLDSPTPAGRVYHLVAGPERSATVAEIVGSAVRYFNAHVASRRIAPIEFIPPHVWNAEAAPSQTAAHDAVDVYTPYTCLSHSFDDRNTRRALAGNGIHPLDVRRYLGRLLEFCLSTGWGKTLRRAA